MVLGRLLAACVLLALAAIPLAAPLNPVLRIIVFFSDHVSGPWLYALEARPLSGVVRLEGLRSPVTVVVDVNGVPHIYGEYEADVFMVLGWVQARDRFWQMDVLRRMGYGNLSALLGPAALELDKLFRTLGYHIAVEESYRVVAELARGGDEWARRALEALEAYARGVNAWLERARAANAIPIEYRLLGAEPEPWRPQDSLAVAAVMIHGLGFAQTDFLLSAIVASGNDWLVGLMLEVTRWLAEINATILAPGEWRAYAELAQGLSFKPQVPVADRGAVELAGEVDADRLRAYAAAVARLAPAWGAMSNNWVVAGALTDTGYPLLANDPHLELTVPPVWYEFHLVAYDTGLNVYGVGFPGVPFVIIGRNERVAVGYTNSMIDVTDFYYYAWLDNETYVYKGEPRRADVRVERILVRDPLTGRYSVYEHRVLETVHGPVLEVEVNGTAIRLAVRTTTTIPSAVVVWAYRVMHARTVYDVLEAQQYFFAPIQNAVAADVEGNILYSPSGLIPVRTRLPVVVVEAPNGTMRVVNTGFLPFNGSRGEGEWLGFVDFASIPRLLNPPRGYVVTANNLIAADYPYYLQLAVCDRYRYARIVELIEEGVRRGELTAEDMKRIQLDTVSLAAKSIIELASAILGEELVGEWDYGMRVDDYRPALAYALIRELHDLLWRQVFEKAGLSADYGCRGLRLELTEYVLKRAAAGDTWYLERLGYSDPEALVREALERARARLAELYGTDDVLGWVYGAKHRYVIRHVLGDYFPWLNYPEYPAPGGPYTVNPSPEPELGYWVRHGPSVRFVASLEPGAEPPAWFQLPGGNSGNPFSRFYDNQLEGWVAGRYHAASLERNPLKLAEVVDVVSQAVFVPAR